VNQPLYIRSTACISPQQSFGLPFPQPPVVTTGTRLTCIQPDYRLLLDPKLIRRMSRIIRMGAAAALSCLREAGIAVPDAIVTGTAYGCLEDTGLFLSSMIERNEEMLQPATFIQSTHNTVGAQIALLLQCMGYNNTIAHRGSSFETALLDASMLLADEEAATVLVGGVDEITDTSHRLMERFGLYRRRPVSNLELFTPRAKGTIAGEGAAFFLLTARPSGQDLARIDSVQTSRVPPDWRELLYSHGLDPADIELLITGDNGDEDGDRVYQQLRDSVFPGRPAETYKQLCGEYPTSTSFGLWVAAQRIRAGAGRVLLYNHYPGSYHTAFLLSSADKPLTHAAP
jgi:3-oxoacyl-[acyl-carrier-protein] synthase II